jgi:hypothetical protein
MTDGAISVTKIARMGAATAWGPSVYGMARVCLCRLLREPPKAFCHVERLCGGIPATCDPFDGGTVASHALSIRMRTEIILGANGTCCRSADGILSNVAAAAFSLAQLWLKLARTAFHAISLSFGGLMKSRCARSGLHRSLKRDLHTFWADEARCHVGTSKIWVESSSGCIAGAEGHTTRGPRGLAERYVGSVCSYGKMHQQIEVRICR